MKINREAPDSVIWELLRRNRRGCRADSFCWLLPARRGEAVAVSGHAWTSENFRRAGRCRVENLRGLHLFPAMVVEVSAISMIEGERRRPAGTLRHNIGL
ncbi:hypothetical protein KCP74_04200 [Salmonella enterica subsp. enterica]|nr:hypothetical protein KCP74_04200 [Salmonella enterica subsp. enterica]